MPLQAFLFELGYGVLCWRVFRGGWALLAVIVGFNLANLSLFVPAIPGPEDAMAGRPFGALAFALAAVGVYGVVALIVAERTREIGIRLALGASPRGLVALVVRQAAYVTLAGAAAGVILAIALSPLVASQLFGVGGSDPATIAIVVAALLTAALLAAAIPAARVLRVDPITTLRCD